MKGKKRTVELVVVSDIHLGTYGSHAKELHRYFQIKENVKTAVKYISKFEHTAATLAIQKGFDCIVCGHIHQPEIKEIALAKGGQITYMNSGDWIENLSALEYNQGEWSIYRHPRDENNELDIMAEEYAGSTMLDLNSKDIFKLLMREFQL